MEKNETFVNHGHIGKFVTFFIRDDTPGDRIHVETPSNSNAPKKPPYKRRKVNPYGDIIISDEQFKKATQQAEGKEKKKKGEADSSKSKKTQLKQQLNNDSSDNEKIEEDGDSIVLSESDDEDQVIMKKYLFPPISERQTNLFLIDLWKKVNPPVTEESLLNAWFATIYYTDINKKKKPKLFVGKVLRRFLADANGATTHLQLDCLSPAVRKLATGLHELSPHLPRDIGLFET